MFLKTWTRLFAFQFKLIPWERNEFMYFPLPTLGEIVGQFEHSILGCVTCQGEKKNLWIHEHEGCCSWEYLAHLFAIILLSAYRKSVAGSAQAFSITIKTKLSINDSYLWLNWYALIYLVQWRASISIKLTRLISSLFLTIFFMDVVSLFLFKRNDLRSKFLVINSLSYFWFKIKNQVENMSTFEQWSNNDNSLI